MEDRDVNAESSFRFRTLRLPNSHIGLKYLDDLSKREGVFMFLGTPLLCQSIYIYRIEV